MLAGSLLRRVVLAAVILGREPSPVLRVELVERDRMLGKLVADLLAPRTMPPLDDTLGLAVLDAGMQELDAELGADRDQRLGDVRRPEIDVVGSRQPVF